jgi:hypothetical protein
MAKTGMLIYDFSQQLPDQQHNPSAQLAFAVETFRRVNDPLGDLRSEKLTLDPLNIDHVMLDQRA